VFAIPYPPNSSAGVGCNAAIKQGGFLVENVEDIASQFSMDLTKAKPQVSLSVDEEKIYTALKDLTEGHINEISERSSVPPFKARAILSSLEIKGLVVSLGGNRYSVV
jgi:DNA processing protein